MRVSVTTRPSDKGEWRWGCGHSDPEKRGGGGPSLKKNCFQPKNKGGGLAPPLLFVSGICSAPLVLYTITTAEGKINNKKERIPLRPVNIVSRGDWF